MGCEKWCETGKFSLFDQLGKCLRTLEGHDALVGHLQLRGSILVSGGSDGRICIVR